MNVVSELIHSVYDCKSYGLFLRDRKRKTFLFGFLLVLLYFLVTILLPFTRFQVSTGGIMKIIDEVVPDFEISDSRLTVERQFEFDQDDIYIYVNTEQEEMDLGKVQEYLRRYDTVVIADAENLVVKSGVQMEQIQFSDLDPDLEISKTGMIDMFRPFVTIVIVVVLLAIFLFMEVSFFFGVLFVGLFGMIVASCMQAKLTFGELYKLGIYTRTTPLLIKAILSFLPVGLPFYTIISLGISLGYLSVGIRHINAPVKEDPVVFYSEGMGTEDRWSRPEEEADRWSRIEDSQDKNS